MQDKLTGGQVAKLLGVDRVTVWKWRRDGKIHADTVLLPGGCVYVYPCSEVKRLKKDRRKRSAK